MKHPNFYENLTEALMRLKHTIVLYDGEPVYIYTITNHMPDGQFRVYFSSIVEANKNLNNIAPIHQLPNEHPSMGPQMDEFMKASSIKIFRKKMESKHFNDFRPFPLGMMNLKENVLYVERKPVRPKVEQGLQYNMLEGTEISIVRNNNKLQIPILCAEFRDCVMGDYPSPRRCLEELTKGEVENLAVAFNRNFAVVRGPIDTLFLAYKRDVVGVLPRGDFYSLRLGKNYKHVKEAARELRLFTNID